MPQIIIHTSTLNTAQMTKIEQSFGSASALKKKNQHYRLDLNEQPNLTDLARLSQDLKVDLNLLPDNFSAAEIKLVISDMDSTLISIECVDEIADYINVKPQVAAITEQAMRGELDFEASLKQRVALLKGLDSKALQDVYEQRLSLSPGAEKWITGLQQKNIKFALVSGGFTFFTDRLAQWLNLDYSRANTLEQSQQKLTGRVLGKIIGAQAKADFLVELCQQLKIKPNQVIAVGDGANDLEMMKLAGLSIAFNAKPTVQTQAKAALNFSGLDAILDFIETH